MKSFAFLLLASCAGEPADERFPVAPSSEGSEKPTTGDAMLRGNICISDDLLQLRNCRTDNLAGFTVTLAGETATTDDRGNFELPRPRGSLLSFTVSGPGAVTTTTPFSPSLTLPVIDADVYARALASHQIFASEGTGAILGNVVRSGAPARDIEIESDPLGSFAPLFDTEPGFGPDRTGARGVFWMPGITAGGASLTMRDRASGGISTVAGIQVVNGGVTILDSLVMP